MNKKFICKMLENIFKQYYQNGEMLPLSEEDYEKLYEEIIRVKKHEENADLHEIMNDVVYDFLSG